MSLEPAIGTLAGLLAATATYLTVIRPRYKAWRNTRRRRQLGITYLLEGKPETVDERGVISSGYPPITVTLATLSGQLTRNGGTSLADTIHRIEEIVRHNREGIEAQLENLVKQVVEARHVAGETAVLTARTEEVHRRDHGQLVQILSEMRDRIWERFAEQDAKFDEQRLRELTYIAMLHELGIDLEIPPTAADQSEGDAPA